VLISSIVHFCWLIKEESIEEQGTHHFKVVQILTFQRNMLSPSSGLVS